MRGHFIVVEGPDCCGKDTQISLLLEKIPGAVKVNFPNEALESGRRCRQYLLRQLQLTDEEANELFAQNRRESMGPIRARLEAGTTVICSRYAFSGAAYTAAKGQMDVARAAAPDRGLLVPDFTLFLHAPANAVKERYDSRDRYENVAFQSAVLRSFEEVRRLPGVGPWVSVEAAGGVEETARKVWAAAAPLLQRAPAWRDGLFE